MSAITKRSLILLFALATVGCAAKGYPPDGGWTRVYEDDYRYAEQDPGNTKFNTWFWREDSAAVHEFEYRDDNECTEERPCVKLTAKRFTADAADGKTPYINSEMYNNSCVRQGIGHPEEQPYDRLRTAANPWVQTLVAPATLHEKIGKECDKPYPYRRPGEPTPYAADSWNTTTPGRLYTNPFAYLTPEPKWEWYRDLAFNAPYLAEESLSQRIVMKVRAEGEGGGSRGWGFWNTLVAPWQMQFAWFMEIASQEAEPPYRAKPKTWMMTVRGGEEGGYCLTPLAEKWSVYDWHAYAVVWSKEAVDYYVDGQLAARHTEHVPDTGMAFHNWVDNRNYSTKAPANYPLYRDKSNYINYFTVDEGRGESPACGMHAGPACAETRCGSFASSKKTGKKELIDLIKAILEGYP